MTRKHTTVIAHFNIDNHNKNEVERDLWSWASFFHVWSGGVCICSQRRRQRLVHGASTSRSHGTSTSTSGASLLRAPLLALWRQTLLRLRGWLILLTMSFIFARLSLSAASSIYAPFYMRSIFYSRAILKSSQSLFARHSEKRCVLFCFWVCPMEHINCSSLHLPAIVHGGERYFVQEDLLSHEYSPPRPSVSWTNSLV